MPGLPLLRAGCSSAGSTVAQALERLPSGDAKPGASNFNWPALFHALQLYFDLCHPNLLCLLETICD